MKKEDRDTEEIRKMVQMVKETIRERQINAYFEKEGDLYDTI